MARKYRTAFLSLMLAGLLALPTTGLAQQKTAKQCNDEWTAKKAELQASGTKKKDFIAACKAGKPTGAPAGAATTGKPAAPPAAANEPPSGGAKHGTSATTARTAAGKSTGAGQYATEAQAKGHCPGDTVVWANVDSKIYHFSGNRNYGNTKSGAYMCEKDAAAAGIRAAKNEKHP